MESIEKLEGFMLSKLYSNKDTKEYLLGHLYNIETLITHGLDDFYEHNFFWRLFNIKIRNSLENNLYLIQDLIKEFEIDEV